MRKPMALDCLYFLALFLLRISEISGSVLAHEPRANHQTEITTLVTPPEPFACQQNKAYFPFQLSSVEIPNSFNPNLPSDPSFVSAESRLGSPVRFDFCYGAEIRLAQLVLTRRSNLKTLYEVFLLGSDVRVENPENAVFSGGKEFALKIIKNDGRASPYGIIVGTLPVNGKFLTYIARGQFVDSTGKEILTVDRFVTIGELSEGNPFLTKGPCPFGKDYQEIVQTFHIQNNTKIRIKISQCQAEEFGTSQYDILRAEVQDSGAPPPLRNQTFVFEKSDILRELRREDLPEKYFAHSIVHHNSCDSFFIRLPHASYGFTAAHVTSRVDPRLPFGCQGLTPGSPAVPEKLGGGTALLVQYPEKDAIQFNDPTMDYKFCEGVEQCKNQP